MLSSTSRPRARAAPATQHGRADSIPVEWCAGRGAGCRAADHAPRIPARAARPHRHQGRLRRGRLRRLHGRARRARRRSGLAWRPVNACIRLLPSVDGKAVFTVEGLRGADGALHPVQQAMVECHGSQCGFCTPGFVMSLFALYKQRAPSRRATRSSDALVRQPVPLHGLPADRRRGARDVRGCSAPAAGAAPGRGADGSAHRERRPKSELARAARSARSTRHVRIRSRRASAGARRARVDALARAAGRTSGMRASWPAPPTSACGSPSSIAISATSSTSATWRSCAPSRARPTHLTIGAAATLDRRLRRARRDMARAARSVGALRLGADSQQRHAGRQRRQRLADRRFDAGADRAGRDAWCLRRGAATREHAARGLLSRLPEDGAAAGRVRRGDSRAAARVRT